MVITDEGLDEIASRHGADITQGQWGSGTALPTISDTGLGSAIADTLLDITSSVSGNSAQFTHETPSTAGTTRTFSEFTLTFDNSANLNRTVGATFSKTDSFDVTTIVTVNFIRN